MPLNWHASEVTPVENHVNDYPFDFEDSLVPATMFNVGSVRNLNFPGSVYRKRAWCTQFINGPFLTAITVSSPKATQKSSEIFARWISTARPTDVSKPTFRLCQVLVWSFSSNTNVSHSDRDCLRTLLCIEGVEYRFNSQSNYPTDQLFIGFIAQQVQQFIPQAVTEANGTCSTMDKVLNNQ